MSSFQQEDFHVWKIKIQLARQNSPQAIEELRNQIAPFLHPQHPLLVANFSQLLGDAVLRSLPKGELFGPYQLYSSVPSFILLKGRAVIQCINLEGDNEIVTSCEKGGLLEVCESQLRSKYGQGNSSLLTKFEVLAEQRSLLIELNSRSLLGALTKVNGQVTLRQEVLMRKYMLIALKHISKITYTKGTNINCHFYLLEGRACFYDKQSRQMLCCYQEGLFNPKELSNQQRPLYLFEGSYLMLLQEEMLKEEVALGIETRREQHLNSINSTYQKMSQEQKQKVQEGLIGKYVLNRKEVERQIYGIQKIEKTMDKRVKSKNDFIQTSSSIKDKCGIRIRKSKKTT